MPQPGCLAPLDRQDSANAAVPKEPITWRIKAWQPKASAKYIEGIHGL